MNILSCLYVKIIFWFDFFQVYTMNIGKYQIDSVLLGLIKGWRFDALNLLLKSLLPKKLVNLHFLKHVVRMLLIWRKSNVQKTPGKTFGLPENVCIKKDGFLDRLVEWKSTWMPQKLSKWLVNGM